MSPLFVFNRRHTTFAYLTPYCKGRQCQWIPLFCKYWIFQSIDLSNMGMISYSFAWQIWGHEMQLETHTEG